VLVLCRLGISISAIIFLWLVTTCGDFKLVASQKSRQVKSQQVRLNFQKVGLMDALAV
jgi:hypothetical protein